MSVFHYGPDYPDETYVPHSYQENTIDLGEVVMNYAVAGDPASPALLLIPGQTESWWGYEKVMGLLAKRFQCRAVGPQGQGRATRTLGRYTLDNMGNDLVRFLALAVKRPVIVSGLSSGGLLTAWLSAYGIPGSIRGAIYEDTPLFAAELNPACGHSIRQSTGPAWALHAKFLGDRWSVGDWSDLKAAVRRELPPSLAVMGERLIPQVEEPPQELKEYDPEWARATSTGTLAASSDHARCSPLLKCRSHTITSAASTRNRVAVGRLLPAAYACELVRSAGQPVDYRSFPTMGHRALPRPSALCANLARMDVRAGMAGGR